jgi:hypothetical protein
LGSSQSHARLYPLPKCLRRNIPGQRTAPAAGNDIGPPPQPRRNQSRHRRPKPHNIKMPNRPLIPQFFFLQAWKYLNKFLENISHKGTKYTKEELDFPLYFFFDKKKTI